MYFKKKGLKKWVNDKCNLIYGQYQKTLKQCKNKLIWYFFVWILFTCIGQVCLSIVRFYIITAMNKKLSCLQNNGLRLLTDWSHPPPTEIDARAQPNSWSRARPRAHLFTSPLPPHPDQTDTRKKNFDNPTFKTGLSDASFKHVINVITDLSK